MRWMRITCKNCTHRKPFFISGGCDVKGKRSKHPEECTEFTEDPEKWETVGDADIDATEKALVLLCVLHAIAVVLRIAIAFM